MTPCVRSVLPQYCGLPLERCAICRRYLSRNEALRHGSSCLRSVDDVTLALAAS